MVAIQLAADNKTGELKVVLQPEKLPQNELFVIFHHCWCTSVAFVTEECGAIHHCVQTEISIEFKFFFYLML
jgi:hypothetical protein